jgi:hypothetical protein
MASGHVSRLKNKGTPIASACRPTKGNYNETVSFLEQAVYFAPEHVVIEVVVQAASGADAD